MPENDGFRAERTQREARIFEGSPFSMLELRFETSVVSAPSAFDASSKLVRVRVDDS